MGEPIREEWITRVAHGRTFADVGGLFGVVNEQVTVAAAAGATALTMIDVAPLEHEIWARFRERVAAAGVQCAEVRANLDDPALPERVGTFETVSCSGVIYHCPNPLHSLSQLRRITSGTLVLGTATIPEVIETDAGRLQTAPGSALLVPALSATQRAVVADWLRPVAGDGAHGITAPLADGWSVGDYAAWWWCFTRDHVAGLLEAAGFRVRQVESYWAGRATFYLAD